MSKSVIRCLSFLLLLTFITGQVSAGEISLSSSNDKLAPSLSSDPDINPSRSANVRASASGAMLPAAIGAGQPLIDLARGKLPIKLVLSQEKDAVRILEGIQEAVELGLKRYNDGASYITKPQLKKLADLAKPNLVQLSNFLSMRLYPFNAVVEGEDDYLLSFTVGKIDGLAVDFIAWLYAHYSSEVAQLRLAQYIFRGAIPAREFIIKMGIVEKAEQDALYDSILTPIFGKEEVKGLKEDIGDFIAEKLGKPIRTADKDVRASTSGAEPRRSTSGIEFKVPEGQPKGFFTNDYHSYRIGELLKGPLTQLPDKVVNVVKKKLDRDIKDGRILSAVVKDFGGTDIDIHVTHRYGELNAAVQRLIIEAMREGGLKAQELGLLKGNIDVRSMSLSDLAKALRLKYQTHSITERGSESVVMAKIIGAGIGAANIKLYHEFFVPGSTPLQKLGFLPVVDLSKDKPDKLPVRGFRAIVRRTEDVLKGNFDGPVWEFEKSAELKVINKDKTETIYQSKDESSELLVFASQPNDYLITAIYAVEGSLLPSTEPITSVVYQPVYGEEGDLRTLNPTFIARSQSGADAVGGVTSMFYDVNFVPGGPNGERYVVTKPATLKEARKAPKEGTAHVVVYGWQSKGNGVIPKEKDGIIDHVAINPPPLEPERKLADRLASIMTTHRYDQPYLAPFAAQAQAEPLREAQSHLFQRAPKEADIDPFMDEGEAKVASGEYLAVVDDKADMGGKFGHNFTPEYMLAIDLATAMEAQGKGVLSDGNIIGFVNKMRLKRGTTNSVGDDSHILMLGDKSRNNAESHQLSFLAFTRGYLASMVGNAPDGKTPEKPYGRGQDFAGKEAKLAMKNPYFYSHFSERFFEILRKVMPLDYMQMVENMEKGWREWQQTSKEGIVLPEPFSGNVSQQGIGSARYLVDMAGGERTFGILAGDKMGPAALNRPIREGVYAALSAGEFGNGLAFEIWDAKAFDEHGNIPLNELPSAFSDVEEAIHELKDKANQDFVRNSYNADGSLKTSLTTSEKEQLAAILKKSGYVPSKRIFLDAGMDKEAIYKYLADSDRFNVKQVWSKSKAGWNISRPQDYLERPILGSSVTKLGILAGGEYIGKDDPVMIGNMRLMEHIYEFLKANPLIVQGDMNGSHWLAAIPTAFKYAVANKDSHPILVGLVYTLSEDGRTLASVEDVFGKKDYAPMRRKMFEFNHRFKQAQLGGQFEPYGTNWRTVEAAYPLAKLLRALEAPDSPFLVKNKPEDVRHSRPIGVLSEMTGLFDTTTSRASASPSASLGASAEQRRSTSGAEPEEHRSTSGMEPIIATGEDAVGELIITTSRELVKGIMIVGEKKPLPVNIESINKASTLLRAGRILIIQGKTATIAPPLSGGSGLSAGEGESGRASTSGKAEAPAKIGATTLTESTYDVTKELQLHADIFKANLDRILAEHPQATFVLAVDTDIGSKAHHAQIMPIHKAIDQLKDLKDANGKPLLPNLLVIRASGKISLVSKILETKANPGNVFVVAQKSNIDNGQFKGLEGGAWITAIDDSNAGQFSYMPVFEAATLAIMSGLNADLDSIRRFYDAVADKPIPPDALEEMLRNRVIYLLPRITRYDPTELRKLYELAAQVHIAA